MEFPTLTIEKAKRKGRQVVKTREFRATGLGWVAADRFWDLGSSTKSTRPVWVAYAASEQESRAFTANFRGGQVVRRNRGRFRDDRLEIPKKALHRWTTQRVLDSVVTVAYLPELFHLDPGLPPDHIRFLFMPPTWWLDEQEGELRGEFGDEARDVARAAYFVAYLDRRSPLPIVHDLRFHLQLFRAAREEPWLLEMDPENSRLGWTGVTGCGLEAPLGCFANHQDFEAFLKSQTAKYFEEEIRNGQNRVRTDCRVLPIPDGTAEQLCLHLAP